jgi:hypothetical protein
MSSSPAELPSLASRLSRITNARRVRLQALSSLPPSSSADTAPSTGKPVSHQFAKELLAGFAGAEVDRLAETRGADYIDRERAKREARNRSEELYDQHYGNNDQYDPNQEPPRHVKEHFGW